MAPWSCRDRHIEPFYSLNHTDGKNGGRTNVTQRTGIQIVKQNCKWNAASPPSFSESIRVEFQTWPQLTGARRCLFVTSSDAVQLHCNVWLFVCDLTIRRREGGWFDPINLHPVDKTPSALSVTWNTHRYVHTVSKYTPEKKLHTMK